jgi:hypothetical protein
MLHSLYAPLGQRSLRRVPEVQLVYPKKGCVSKVHIAPLIKKGCKSK